MKIVFFGTPDFAVHFLASLKEDEDVSIVGVVSQPDKPVGRKQVITPTPVKSYATEQSIPVLSLSQEKLREVKADLFVIVAYGKIIPQEILDIPKLGNINVHPSKLPLWRGPSPMQAAIAAGDKETAISVMLIDNKMDHGPLLAQMPLIIDSKETPASLTKKVAELGAPLLVRTLQGFIKGDIIPHEQDHNIATFCKLLKREDGEIEWSESAKTIEQKIRAYTPWPGSYTINPDTNNKIKIHVAALPIFKGELEGVTKLKPGLISIVEKKLLIGTSTSPLEILELQPEGKQRMSARDFINGNKELEGKILK